MIRCFMWNLFVVLTLGMVSVNIVYKDGLYFHYKSWLERV